MTAPRPLLLGAEIDGAGRHPAAWRLPGADAGADPGAGPAARWFGPARAERLAAAADAADLDLLVVPDAFAPRSRRAGEFRGRLDAVALTARLAPGTSRVGLVPVVTTTHTEPFHTSKALATLDLVSGGRAGWQVGVSTTAEEAAAFGRRAAPGEEEAWAEASDAAEVVRRLWDSWEDDAVVRDAATGRYVDRDKLHPVDFAGRWFSVKGPSITPRPPQGHPLVVVPAASDASLAVAAAHADAVRVRARDAEDALAARERVRAAVAAAGRDPDAVAVLLDVEVLLREEDGRAAEVLAGLDAALAVGPGAEPGAEPGADLRFTGTPAGLAALLGELAAAGAADGAVLVPLDLPATLDLVARRLVPLLRDAGLRPPETAPGTPLRARFGLPRPANAFAG